MKISKLKVKKKNDNLEIDEVKKELTAELCLLKCNLDEVQIGYESFLKSKNPNIAFLQKNKKYRNLLKISFERSQGIYERMVIDANEAINESELREKFHNNHSEFLLQLNRFRHSLSIIDAIRRMELVFRDYIEKVGGTKRFVQDLTEFCNGLDRGELQDINELKPEDIYSCQEGDLELIEEREKLIFAYDQFLEMGRDARSLLNFFNQVQPHSTFPLSDYIELLPPARRKQTEETLRNLILYYGGIILGEGRLEKNSFIRLLALNVPLPQLPAPTQF